MSIVEFGFVLTADSSAPMMGVADVEYVSTDGGDFLFVGSGLTGAIVSYRIAPGAFPELASVLKPEDAFGTEGLSDLVQVGLDGSQHLLPLGRYGDSFALYDVDEAGALVELAVLTGDPIFERGLTGETVTIDGRTYLYTSRFGAGGFDEYRVFNNGAFKFKGTVHDTPWRVLGDVTALHVTSLHGIDMFFAASALDGGMHSHLLGTWGATSLVDRFIPYVGDQFAAPQDIESAQIAERAFVLMASAQSDTISVVRVSQAGMMKLVDEEEDTLHTRFEGVHEIEVFEAGGRVFVVAAGSDDGITLFELNYRGRLVHLESVRDEFFTTLADVSSLEVVVDGETAHIYAGSSAEHGVTELIVDLSRSGEVVHGGPVPEVLHGTRGDDVIWGMGRSDELFGGAGADRLVDGRGRDQLTGGPGPDVFEFIPDGRTDWILDFEPGVDLIDLSNFDRVDHPDSVFLGDRINGAVIIVGEDIIRLTNPEGGRWYLEDFKDDMFIFG
ncbi:hypothetical protein ACW9UR_11090 [Halovulum sp. GXIMD14794]